MLFIEIKLFLSNFFFKKKTQVLSIFSMFRAYRMLDVDIFVLSTKRGIYLTEMRKTFHWLFSASEIMY